MSRIVEYRAEFVVRWPRTGRVSTIRTPLPLGALGLFLAAQRTRQDERVELVRKLGLGSRVIPVALTVIPPGDEPICVYDTRTEEQKAAA